MDPPLTILPPPSNAGLGQVWVGSRSCHGLFGMTHSQHVPSVESGRVGLCLPIEHVGSDFLAWVRIFVFGSGLLD